MKIILKGLNGLLTSKIIEVPDYYCDRIYFAVNKMPVKFDRNDGVPSEVYFNKLTFSLTGRIFRNKKKLPIYEYELTDI